MKKIIVLTALICIVSLKTAAAQNQAEKDSLSGPSLEFKSLDHDFGTVGSDTTLIHKFVFSNTGNDSLLIRGVRPG